MRRRAIFLASSLAFAAARTGKAAVATTTGTVGCGATMRVPEGWLTALTCPDRNRT